MLITQTVSIFLFYKSRSRKSHLTRARRQRGSRGAMPPRFSFLPPDFFLCPPRCFFGRKKLVFFGREKTLKFAILARKSLRISAKTFFFFGDHLLLIGKFVISARKSFRISAKTFFFFADHQLLLVGKFCDFGQKNPSHFGENLCPPDFNFAPPDLAKLATPLHLT